MADKDSSDNEDETEEGLKIVESDSELDDSLDNKSSKFALTAINVKSIIHVCVLN